MWLMLVVVCLEVLNEDELSKRFYFSGPAIPALRGQSQSSIYDPFAGMKTPGQRELITLQEQVKLGILTVNEAALRFKEWQLNQKRRAESFRFQQVCGSEMRTWVKATAFPNLLQHLICIIPYLSFCLVTGKTKMLLPSLRMSIKLWLH